MTKSNRQNFFISDPLMSYIYEVELPLFGDPQTGPSTQV